MELIARQDASIAKLGLGFMYKTKTKKEAEVRG